LTDATFARTLADTRNERIMFEHWREYLYRTPMAYVSPTRFRETFRYWSPTIRRRVDMDKELDRELRAKETQRREDTSEGPQRIGDLLKGHGHE